MKIETILCPIDFSEYNASTNRYASMLARSTGAKIIYLHVHVPDSYEATPAYVESQKTKRKLAAELEEFVRPVGGGIAASYVVEFGLPTERILKYAHKLAVDLIVMGTHGRTGISRLLLGSIAEAIVRKAECPVLAVKADSKVPSTA